MTKAVLGSFQSTMLSVLELLSNSMVAHFVRNCGQRARGCHPELEPTSAATAGLLRFLW